MIYLGTATNSYAYYIKALFISKLYSYCFAIYNYASKNTVLSNYSQRNLLVFSSILYNFILWQSITQSYVV